MRMMRIEALIVLTLIVSAGCARRHSSFSSEIDSPYVATPDDTMRSHNFRDLVASGAESPADTQFAHDDAIDARLAEISNRRDMRKYIRDGACRAYSVDAERTIAVVEVGPRWSRLDHGEKVLIAMTVRILTRLRKLGEVRFVDHGQVVGHQYSMTGPVE